MKQFNEDMYLILPSVLEDLLRQPPINPSIFLNGIKSQSIKGSILLTIEELREAVKDGYDEGRDSVVNDWNDFKGAFEQYLKRKGINITENGK